MREAAAKKRGYADSWEWPADRKLAELEVVRTLADYLAFAEGASWKSATSVSDDPPDALLISVDGRRFGVEVTELVDPDTVKRHRHRLKTGEGSPYDWADWTADLAASRIAELVEAKDQKLAAAREHYHELFVAIMTDEPAITLELAQLAVGLGRPRVDNIDRAFLLLSYHPAVDAGAYPGGHAVLPINLDGPVGPENFKWAR